MLEKIQYGIASTPYISTNNLLKWGVSVFTLSFPLTTTKSIQRPFIHCETQRSSQKKKQSNCRHLYYQSLDKVDWTSASNSYTMRFRTFALNGIISANVRVGKQLKTKSLKSPSSLNWLRHRLAIPSSPRCTAIESASISGPKKRQRLFVVPAFFSSSSVLLSTNGASANSFLVLPLSIKSWCC